MMARTGPNGGLTVVSPPDHVEIAPARLNPKPEGRKKPEIPKRFAVSARDGNYTFADEIPVEGGRRWKRCLIPDQKVRAANFGKASATINRMPVSMPATSRGWRVWTKPLLRTAIAAVMCKAQRPNLRLFL
jgi:hypothetical protein